MAERWTGDRERSLRSSSSSEFVGGASSPKNLGNSQHEAFETQEAAKLS